MRKSNRALRLLLAAAGALALTGTVVGVSANAADNGPTLTHAQAAARLKAADITWVSSNHCSDKNGSGCTSFTGIRKATIDGVIGLKRKSGCDIVITGAAEVKPHSTTGTYTHGQGYKVDVSLTSCVTDYIEHHASRGSDRESDGAPQWTAAGVIYAKETAKHHWDITYTGGPGGNSSPGKPSSSGSWPVLRDGAHGTAVTTVQSLLNAAGAKIAADGRYGPATVSAVKAFQTGHHLDADGVTGPDTWERLAPVLRSGAQGEAVAAMQRLLNAAGAKIAADGRYGPATVSAVKAFQTGHHLDADGITGPDTWRSLLAG